jgi:uncharacterized protein with HEPN domain
MPKDDIVRLRHILDAVKEALSFTKGKSRADLNIDRIVKELEKIVPPQV